MNIPLTKRTQRSWVIMCPHMDLHSEVPRDGPTDLTAYKMLNINLGTNEGESRLATLNMTFSVMWYLMSLG
jgi:hypothetical protein